MQIHFTLKMLIKYYNNKIQDAVWLMGNNNIVVNHIKIVIWYQLITLK